MVVLALTQKNLSPESDGDRSCWYLEESVMKSFLGLLRRIQHLVETSKVVGSTIRYGPNHQKPPRRKSVRETTK
ncbi:hypothetical protein BDV12DRAFT_169135 [Aspergillus spectabilis]